MSKRLQRSSFKKMPLNIYKHIQRLIHSQEKIKSLKKEKQPSYKITIDDDYNKTRRVVAGARTRIKTETDQRINISQRIHKKSSNLKKKRTINDEEEPYMRKIDTEMKFRDNSSSKFKSNNAKKAFFLAEAYLSNNKKKQSIQKYDMPLTAKSNMRKVFIDKQASYRFGNDSNEKIVTNSKGKGLINTTQDELKKTGEKTLEKTKRNVHNEVLVEQQKAIFQDQQPRTQSNVREKKHRKLRTDLLDMDSPKFQLVFEKRRDQNRFDLSKQELQTFGDRFPESFQKLKLLGRGGFALVWLGEHKRTRKQFAVKQIKTENTHQTHIKQIWFGTYFFEIGGLPKKEFSAQKGIKNLVKLYSYDINKSDTWIFYEKCGQSLGNALYDLKGENHGNERLYRAVYKEFYGQIKNNQNQLRKVIVEVAKALQLLSENRIVHSDLKTENILVKVKENTKDGIIDQVKLIDYGSAFTFGNLKQFSMATPQYMAPEVLNYILYENELEYAPKLLEFLKEYNNPWVIDMWSLGCVLLEIVSGIPLWMSLKTIVTGKRGEIVKYGLFAIKGRVFDKIIKKQIEVVQNMDYYLAQENYSGIVLEEDLKKALRKMLSIDPAKRISPEELIAFLEP